MGVLLFADTIGNLNSTMNNTDTINLGNSTDELIQQFNEDLAPEDVLHHNETVEPRENGQAEKQAPQVNI